MVNYCAKLIRQIKWRSDTGLVTCLSPLSGLQDFLFLLDWSRSACDEGPLGTLLLQDLHSGSGKTWVGQEQAADSPSTCSGLLKPATQMRSVNCPKSQVTNLLPPGRQKSLFLCSGLEEGHSLRALRTFSQPGKHSGELCCHIVVAS